MIHHQANEKVNKKSIVHVLFRVFEMKIINILIIPCKQICIVYIAYLINISLFGFPTSPTDVLNYMYIKS